LTREEELFETSRDAVYSRPLLRAMAEQEGLIEIFGNTVGLSSSAMKALERIYRRRVSLAQITTPELIRSLVDASVETGRQVGALVHRSGAIDYVVVGDAQRLMLPDMGRLRAREGRFRGLRLIHTHVRGEALSRDDLVDLTRLRLDLVAVVHLAPNGDPRSFTYAHNAIPERHGSRSVEPASTRVGSLIVGGSLASNDTGDSVNEGGNDLDARAGNRSFDEPIDHAVEESVEPTSPRAALPYRVVGPIPLSSVAEVDFGRLMADLEAQFASQLATREVRGKDGRAILVHVAENRRREGALSAMEVSDWSLRELTELSRTAGVSVVDAVTQLRPSLDPAYVLGKGKLEDVVLRAIDLDADVLIFDHNLTPAQAANIAKFSDLRVIDRSQLILDIFAQRAESKDGKLQVELAQLKYNMPRLAQKDDSLSRLTGGIGGRGPGETKLEIGRRRAKERVSHLEAQLKKLAEHRKERRKQRSRARIPTIAIVGYTNAGKSSLLNAMTESRVLAEDKLFATLDTRSRVLRAGWAGHGEREVVVTDTVGFIRNLPKDLFSAFRSTFEETEGADLLLHVIDASDKAYAEHIRTTEEVLKDLELDHIERVLVFNKADQITLLRARELQAEYPHALVLSALEMESLRSLFATLRERLMPRWAEVARGPDLTPSDEAWMNERVADPNQEDNASSLEELLARTGRAPKRRREGLTGTTIPEEGNQ
jgi:GTPase